MPLGFARLVLRRRNKDGKTDSTSTIIYATPLLRMHHEDASFSLVRYAWSVRCHPFMKEIEARWEVCAPRGKFLYTTIAQDAGRSPSVGDLLVKAGIISRNDEEAHVKNHVLRTSDVFSIIDGEVRIENSIYTYTKKDMKTGKEKKHWHYEFDTWLWNRRYTDLGTDSLPDLAQIPEYLRGAEQLP